MTDIYKRKLAQAQLQQLIEISTIIENMDIQDNAELEAFKDEINKIIISLQEFQKKESTKGKHLNKKIFDKLINIFQKILANEIRAQQLIKIQEILIMMLDEYSKLSPIESSIAKKTSIASTKAHDDIGLEHGSSIESLYNAVYQENIDDIKLLLQHNVDPNESYKNVNPLWLAVQKGRLDIVKLLIEYGANVNTTYAGKTALLVAAQQKNMEMVELLLQRGAIIKESESVQYHRLIMNLMGDLEYPTRTDGVCKGIAMMAIQAKLIGQEKQFNERLKFIGKYNNQLKILIKQAKEIIKRESHIKTEPGFVSELTDKHRKALDVLSFFDGIELYFDPERHKEVFNKSLTQSKEEDISLLTASEEIEKLGGLQKVFSTCNTYTKHSLTTYLEKIKAHIEQNNLQNISIQISSTTHAIAIQYDLQSKKWSLIDANQLYKIDKTLDTSELTTEIMLALNQTDNAFISSQIFATQQNNKANNLELLFADLHDISEHEITPEKMNVISPQGEFFLYSAIIQGETTIVKSLLEKGADINQPYNGESLLSIAIRQGHKDIVELLLQQGIDIGAEPQSLLIIASIQKNKEIEEILTTHIAAKKLLDKYSDNTAPVPQKALLEEEYKNICSTVTRSFVPWPFNILTNLFLPKPNNKTEQIKELQIVINSLNSAKLSAEIKMSVLRIVLEYFRKDELATTSLPERKNPFLQLLSNIEAQLPQNQFGQKFTTDAKDMKNFIAFFGLFVGHDSKLFNSDLHKLYVRIAGNSMLNNISELPTEETQQKLLTTRAKLQQSSADVQSSPYIKPTTQSRLQNPFNKQRS